MGEHCHCPKHPSRHSEMSVGCENAQPWDGEGCNGTQWTNRAKPWNWPQLILDKCSERASPGDKLRRRAALHEEAAAHLRQLAETLDLSEDD